jgi:hypothetical protein
MTVSAATKRLVRRRAAYRCEYCHADEQWQFVRFTIDHIVPRSEGYSDEAVNLALACRNCNERRSNRSTAEDPNGGEVVRLFNPRSDEWGDHFAWDRELIRIIGRTPTGRATDSILDFNDEQHGHRAIEIRRRDLADGFHPPPDDPIRDE